MLLTLGLIFRKTVVTSTDTVYYMSTCMVESTWNVMAHAQITYFVFRRNGRVHLNRQGASVQSTTGRRGVCINGTNAGYTMFRGSVKSSGYPLHSPFSPSLSLPLRHRVPSHFQTHYTPWYIGIWLCWNFIKRIYNLSRYKMFECRSQWPRGLRRRSAAARLLRSWVRIPSGGMDVCLLWVLCVVR